MKIIWTSKAEKHLSQIFDYIAEDSPYYASRTIERIISIAEKISKIHIREGLFLNIRIEILGRFLCILTELFTSLKKSEIYILSVIHEARSLPDNM